MATAKPRIWRSALISALSTSAMLAALALAATLVVVPKLMGGMSLTVLSGSMRPSIQPGDVVVTRGIEPDQVANLKVGDVITFLPYPDDPTMVTHRIVGMAVSGGAGTRFVTQGDDNNHVDAWGPVGAEQIRGQVVYKVPLVGWVREWVGNNAQWAVFGAAALLIGYGVISFSRSFRRPKSNQDDPPARRVLESEGLA